jgi:hypothetical protein
MQSHTHNQRVSEKQKSLPQQKRMFDESLEHEIIPHPMPMLAQTRVLGKRSPALV